jgi:hypothetical protein
MSWNILAESLMVRASNGGGVIEVDRAGEVGRSAGRLRDAEAHGLSFCTGEDLVLDVNVTLRIDSLGGYEVVDLGRFGVGFLGGFLLLDWDIA